MSRRATAPASPKAAPSAAADLADAARRLFEQLAAEHPEAPPIEEHLAVVDAAIAMRLERASVLSLDIFDTALVRLLRTPRDVFLFLAQLEPFTGLGLAPDVLASQRIAAERRARRASLRSTGSAEVLLADIHRELAAALGCPEAAQQMAEAERTVERVACRPHPWTLALFRGARAAGKRIWFVSDTYHDAAFLRELLTISGYDDPDALVISSAESRASKGAGTLFAAVLARTGVRASDVLHVGDNAHSDGTRAVAAGWRAAVHPLAASTDAVAMSPNPAAALVHGVGRVTGRASSHTPDYWWRFGAEVAGPLLAGFSLWLAGRLHASGSTRAFFLLRDGEILERVFRTMTEGWQGLPPTALLHSSRRAFVLPALETGDASVVSQLSVGVVGKPLRALLARFDVEANGLDAVARRHGFGGLDTPVSLPPDQGAAPLYRFVQDPAVWERFVARSRQERALLAGYLAQEGVFDGRVAFVDIGWNGTIQKAARKVARLEGRRLQDAGWYLGTGPGIASPDEPELMQAGWLFDRGAPSSRHETVAMCREVIEFICSSTRGGLRRFDARDGRIVPIEEPADHAGAQAEALQTVHAGALAYATALRGELGRFGVFDIPADAALEPLGRVLANPSAEDARHLGGIAHGEGVGSAAARHLARFPDDAQTLAAWRQALRQAYWPRGLLALRDPRAMALRAADALQAATAPR